MKARPPLTREWSERLLAYVAGAPFRTTDDVRQWRAAAGLPDMAEPIRAAVQEVPL